MSRVAHLHRCRYPFVLDAFRFHLTLTGSLPARVLDTAMALLRCAYAATIADALIEAAALSLIRQDGADARLAVIDQWPLRPCRS
ncbi:MAG: DUF1045 domain-containing protein [Hyphomicrobiaceae bacterium]